MKKFLTVALCIAAVGSVSAQKINVDKAAKLSGNLAKLSEARQLIQDAMSNPETMNDAKTYYVAGKIEFDAFDKATTAKMLNPNDPNANDKVMADEIIKGYEYFVKALPLDSLPNEKGQVKPKFSKDINNKIAGHHADFSNAGGTYFNSQAFYPEAYSAFMIAGDIYSSGNLGNLAKVITPAQVGMTYFNAGLSAHQGNEFVKAAEAFRKASDAGYDKPDSYIYEIASWQTAMQRDSLLENTAKERIFKAAQDGYEKYGLEQPVFFNNVINSMVLDNNVEAALEKLNSVIATNPDNAGLYGLRGYVYDREGKDAESEADYRKAASFENADFETLRNASKKIVRVGQTKWNDISGNSPEMQAKRQEIKTQYFEAAKQIATKAKQLNDTDRDINNVIESIDYMLETYFK